MRLEEQSAKLSCGSAVYHPHHGIGKVQSVRDRNFDSGNDTKYTELYFQREALTLILPIQDAREMVRNPINRAQARQILEHIESWEGRPSSQWKARAATNQEALDRGDPFEYAEVFKGLSRLEAESKLRQNDRGHLSHAMDFLADELSYALGKTPDQVRELITEAAKVP